MADDVDPAAVWDLLRRADDLMKYAENRRDPGVSYNSARTLLDEALALIERMSPGQSDYFREQVDIRRSDLDGLGAP